MRAHQKQSKFAITRRGNFFVATLVLKRGTVRGLGKNPKTAIVRAKSLAGLTLTEAELAALRACD